MPIISYIGVGSNLEQPLEQVSKAQQSLAEIPHITLLRRSPWYSSIALSSELKAKQPNYINGVFELSTQLPPHDLLQVLFDIELSQGRTRETHWGARTLDLDLLLYGDELISSESLTVPHPRMTERNFVLLPLLTLNSQLIVPKKGKISTLLTDLESDNVWLMDGEKDVLSFINE